MKERLFAESKAMGARFIRVDVELAAIFDGPGPSADGANWSRLDEVIELSGRYRLPVLGHRDELAPPGCRAAPRRERGPCAARRATLTSSAAWRARSPHTRDTITHCRGPASRRPSHNPRLGRRT
jgi:hypothetical protein